jgi:hypothetical protein
MMNTDTLLEKILATGEDIAKQLERFNDNVESGSINIRTHHPLCVLPPNREFTILQIEAASKFLAHAIETGALVLPPKDATEVEPAAAGGRS